MNLLLATTDWAQRGGGGITRYSKGLALGLINNKINLGIILEKNGPSSSVNTAGFNKADSELLNLFAVNHFKNPILRALSFFFGFIKYSKDFKFDSIICLTWSPLGTAAFLRKIFFKTPYYIICHGEDVIEPRNSFFYKFLMKLVLKNANIVFPISNYTSSEAIISGAKKENTKIIGCGINPHDIAQYDNNFSLINLLNLKSKKIILTVGRLIPRKGMDMVITSMPSILKLYPDCVYVIVGEGSDETRLKTLVSDLNLENNIFFTGFLSDEKTYKCVSECNIFIMASRKIEATRDVEGFGIVFLEAGYFNKPVICGNSGGMIDAVIQDVTGLIVNPTDKEDISGNILQLLLNDELSKTLGANAHKRVLSDYTWDAVTKRILKHL